MDELAADCSCAVAFVLVLLAGLVGEEADAEATGCLTSRPSLLLKDGMTGA